jgi:hypothetical protein
MQLDATAENLPCSRITVPEIAGRLEQFEVRKDHVREASLGLADAPLRSASAHRAFMNVKPSGMTERLDRITEILSKLAEPITLARGISATAARGP